MNKPKIKKGENIFSDKEANKFFNYQSDQVIVYLYLRYQSIIFYFTI
jgi:hypothetical protein